MMKYELVHFDVYLHDAFMVSLNYTDVAFLVLSHHVLGATLKKTALICFKYVNLLNILQLHL